LIIIDSSIRLIVKINLIDRNLASLDSSWRVISSYLNVLNSTDRNNLSLMRFLVRQTVIEISVVFLALRPSILLVASLIYWNVIFYKLKTVDSSAIQLVHQIYYETFSPLKSLNSNEVRIHWVINVRIIVRQYFILNKLWLWKMLAFSIILFSR